MKETTYRSIWGSSLSGAASVLTGGAQTLAARIGLGAAPRQPPASEDLPAAASLDPKRLLTGSGYLLVIPVSRSVSRRARSEEVSCKLGEDVILDLGLRGVNGRPSAVLACIPYKYVLRF